MSENYCTTDETRIRHDINTTRGIILDLILQGTNLSFHTGHVPCWVHIISFRIVKADHCRLATVLWVRRRASEMAECAGERKTLSLSEAYNNLVNSTIS